MLLGALRLISSKKGFRILFKRALRTKNSTFLKALQVPHQAGFYLTFLRHRMQSLALERCFSGVLPAFSYQIGKL